jgi:hypothetical protein
METQYKKGQQVEVYDTGRKRWYKAEALHLVRYADETMSEAWECHLRNGNRGMFDTDHMRESN